MYIINIIIIEVSKPVVYFCYIILSTMNMIQFYKLTAVDMLPRIRKLHGYSSASHFSHTRLVNKKQQNNNKEEYLITNFSMTTSHKIQFV